MKISVLQKHIDAGIKGNCVKDPIALAVRDAGLDPVWVGPTFIEWGNKSAPTPDEALEFMKAFDNDRLVYPFTFELEG